MRFSGYALLIRHLVALAIPLAILTMFVFVNIPLLDRHPAERYGAGFEASARLVPWVDQGC